MKLKIKQIKYLIFILIAIYYHYFRNESISSCIAILIALAMLAYIFTIVFRNCKNSKHDKKFINSDIKVVDKMNGQEFEEFLLAHFRKLGYSGHTTAVTGDYGADLILTKGSEKVAVQAKRYKSNVGIDAIQQVIGAKAYYHANKGIVATNSYFTKNAINLAKSSNIELIDRNSLIKIMNKNQNLIKKRRVYCDECGSEMKLKHGEYGEFYGCTNFPECKCTKSSN